VPSKLTIALIFAFVLSTAAALSTAPPATYAISTSEYCMDSEEQAFLVLINNYRVQNGLAPLTAVQTLGAAADHHSIDMATNDYVGHTLSDGTTWSQNIRNHGYTYSTYLGENVAAGNKSASGTFRQWQNSPTHNSAMLNAKFKAIGIGRAFNANATYGWYWTTDFGGYVDSGAMVCDGASAPAATNTPSPTPTMTPSPTLMPTNTPEPSPTATSTSAPEPVFVAAMTGKATRKRDSVTLVIKVTIQDARGVAVSGAAVTAALASPTGSTQTLSGTTNSRGQLSWSVTMVTGPGTYVASVTNVAASGRVYDPSLNAISSMTIVVP
jgi:uncharacterized protein YkwD